MNRYKKLTASFYLEENVLKIAKQLIGKILITNFNQQLTAGRIVETEAYNGVIDKASHAYNNRFTERTKIMYEQGGTAYVYLCYGIHHLMNVVTNKKNIPHAILIRALEPLTGLNFMAQRTGKKTNDRTITRGPGNVSKAMGITTKHSGLSLLKNEIYIAVDNFEMNKNSIVSTTRIGVDYAAEDALLPYRFYLKNNEFVSGKK